MSYKDSALHHSLYAGPEYWLEKGEKVGAAVTKKILIGEEPRRIILPGQYKYPIVFADGEFHNNEQITQRTIIPDITDPFSIGLLNHFGVGDIHQIPKSDIFVTAKVRVGINSVPLEGPDYNKQDLEALSGGVYLPGIALVMKSL